MKRAFTLIEILIAIVIVWLLITILFRSYRTMIDISVRVENEKAVQQELLYLNQAMQSLADRYTVDYDQYDAGALLDSQGMVDILHLVSEDGEQASIQTEWNCYGSDIETEEHILSLREKETPCQLVIEQDWSEATAMPSPKLVRLSHVAFKITPYISNQQLLYSGIVADQEQAYTLLQYPWFWLFGRMYHRLYGGWRATNAKAIMHEYHKTTDVLSL